MKEYKGCFIVIVVLVLLVFAIDKCDSYSRTPEAIDSNQKTEAYVYATQFVEEKITSPSTAIFGKMYDSQVTKIAENTYLVKGYLDAQNRFGAMVRMNYKCEVLVLSNKGQCKSITITER
jgi:hypothetical protein